MRSIIPFSTGPGIGPLLCCLLFAALAPLAATAEDATNDVHRILDSLRVLAHDAPDEQGGARVVLVRLDRREQLVVARGQQFEPAHDVLLTVTAINDDGSVYVKGEGLVLGRIRAVTPAERAAWLEQFRDEDKEGP